MEFFGLCVFLFHYIDNYWVSRTQCRRLGRKLYFKSIQTLILKVWRFCTHPGIRSNKIYTQKEIIINELLMFPLISGQYCPLLIIFAVWNCIARNVVQFGTGASYQFRERISHDFGNH